MKSILGFLVGSIVLALVGWVSLTASRLETALADTEQDLIASKYDEADATFATAERYLEYASRLPGVGNGPVNDMRSRRAALKYWQRQYSDLVPPGTEPVSTVAPDNLDLQLVVANAVHRVGQTQSTDRQTTLDALDTSINAYLTVLKNAERHEEAAYNYEYLVRLRQDIERGRRKPGEPEDEGEGPLGREGGPAPQQGNAEEFKIYVPLESEELQQGGGAAGKGTPSERKG